jgi:c-di-GMP-related signal transduction protein
LNGVAAIHPRSKAVIEVADSVPCTAEVILVCENLKRCYWVALAGWRGKKERRPLAAKTGFLLVDMQTLDRPTSEKR